MSSSLRWSVVIPTCSRAEVLPRTLDAYLAQLTPGEDEIVVVDDGSTDDTASILAVYAHRYPNLLRTEHQPNAGPAAARNRALQRSTGRWILFAGDDVLPAPGMLAVHAEVLASGGAVASLGLIRWHPGQTVTPFMRWLEKGGVQFAYAGITDGQSLPPEMAYSSNLAIARHHLPPQPVFDSTFRAACWEDVDLGLRLAAAGVGLRYSEAALGLHWHPTDLVRARQRAERVGYYRAQLHQKHQLPLERRPFCREVIKACAAPLLRVLPFESLRALGYRWTLARPDARGYTRFLREHQSVHSSL